MFFPICLIKFIQNDKSSDSKTHAIAQQSWYLFNQMLFGWHLLIWSQMMISIGWWSQIYPDLDVLNYFFHTKHLFKLICLLVSTGYRDQLWSVPKWSYSALTALTLFGQNFGWSCNLTEQGKPLNAITLGHRETDNINGMIIISEWTTHITW